MQGGQVPVWVPVAVALAGMLSVLLSQWWTTRREDKRWTREVDRENARLFHERQHAREEREHKAMLAWRDERLRTYGEFLGAINDWQRVLQRTFASLAFDDKSPTAGMQKESSKARESAAQALARIEIISPINLSLTCKNVYTAFIAFELDVMSTDGWKNRTPMHPSGAHHDLVAQKNLAQAVLRGGLGVDSVHNKSPAA